VIDARDRFLKPGGCLIPASIQLMAAPVEAADVYQRQVDVWRTRVEGIDLAPLRPLAVNQVHATRFAPDQLLAPPDTLARLDLADVTAPYASGRLTAHASRDGTLHGVCGCFVTTLVDGVTMSNAPGDSATTNFAQAFFPLSEPAGVSRGDRISIEIATRDGHVVRWRVEVERPGDQPLTRFDHSTFGGLLLSQEALRRLADTYRPVLTRRGAMERALLDRFDGSASSSELRRWLLERYRELLPSEEEAAALLKSTIERCG
jgi:hypothetical protein